MSEVNKPLLGFLNGLAKRQYFAEGQYTDDFLRTEVLGSPNEEEYDSLVRRFQSLLNSMVSADMDFAQLDAFLTSQMKKRQGALTEMEAATVRRFWKSQRSKIHERLVASCVWDQHLKEVNWRVDVRTKARYLEQMNQASGIMEMKLGPAESDLVSEIVRFEVDADQLKTILSQVENIQLSIEEHMRL